MTRATTERVRRRMVRRGVEDELRKRGIHNPADPRVKEMIKKRIEEKERLERSPIPELST